MSPAKSVTEIGRVSASSRGAVRRGDFKNNKQRDLDGAVWLDKVGSIGAKRCLDEMKEYFSWKFRVSSIVENVFLLATDPVNQNLLLN